MTVIQCFSVLVAADRGERCEDLRAALRKELLEPDEDTGWLKVRIFKYGRHAYPERHGEIARRLATRVGGFFGDVGSRFFGEDGGSRRAPPPLPRPAPPGTRRAVLPADPLDFPSYRPVARQFARSLRCSSAADAEHVMAFRRTLEWTMTLGYWWGGVARRS